MVYVVIISLIFNLGSATGYQSSSHRPQVAPDHSLLPASYIQKGLPADDRSWDGDAYARAAAVLKDVAAKDPTQLPRSGSLISGAVFARIVSRDNFKLFNNGLLDKRQSFLLANSLLDGLGRITAIYASASTQERIFDVELIELMRCILDLSVEVTQRAEAIVGTLSPTAPDYEARLKGREGMSDGLTRIITGCLDTLTERESYQTADLLRLAQTLDTTVPGIFSFLSQGAQQELLVRIHHDIDQEPSASIKQQLSHLYAALSKSKPA